jgi:serine/threonine-protein kinase
VKIQCYACGQKLDVSEVPPFSRVPCPACHVPIIVPKLYGDLMLEDRIGTGTVAEVFRAVDLTLDREIAVKVLKPELAANPTLCGAFLSQARRISAINHAHVLPIYSCGERDQRPYLVMQYMAGGSLKSRLALQPGGLPLEDLQRWLYECIKGLEAAHVNGISHYDLKPSNILLDADGHVKLVDFGVANIAYSGEPMDPAAEGFEMTLERSWYVPPERISTGLQDALGDIYSLGATFYHAATGQPAFTADNARDNVRQRFRGVPRPPTELRPDLPAAFGELLLAMLKVYPSDRPESYAEVARRLRDLQATRRSDAPPRQSPKRANLSLNPNRGPAGSGEVRRPPAPVAPAIAKTAPTPVAGPLVWACRLAGTVVALTLIVLLLAHALRVPWYERHIRPRLPGAAQPSSAAADSSAGAALAK